MELVKSHIGFVMFADCEVSYNGRANSILPKGNYLIMYKTDGSVTIHGSTDVSPRNYMGAGSTIQKEQNQIIFKRKGEIVCVNVSKAHFLNYLDDWSNSKAKIYRTEKELVSKLFNNWNDYFDDDFEYVEMEHNTELGPIDLVGFTKTTDYIVEVKRRTVTVKDITQLRRYIEAKQCTQRTIKGFMAAPSISKSALNYLNKHELAFIQVDF